MAKVLIAAGRSGVVLRAANRQSPLKADIPDATHNRTITTPVPNDRLYQELPLAQKPTARQLRCSIAISNQRLCVSPNTWVMPRLLRD